MPSALKGLSTATTTPYMISNGGGKGCAMPNNCTRLQGGSYDSMPTTCADLYADLVTGGFIASLPVDPRGSHATSGFVYSQAQTGYYVQKSANNRITVGSCNPEQKPLNTGIFVTR